MNFLKPCVVAGADADGRMFRIYQHSYYKPRNDPFLLPLHNMRSENDKWLILPHPTTSPVSTWKWLKEWHHWHDASCVVVFLSTRPAQMFDIESFLFAVRRTLRNNTFWVNTDGTVLGFSYPMHYRALFVADAHKRLYRYSTYVC